MKNGVEKATVSITKKGGQGILVNGNLIVTAAHCIDFSIEGGMALGDWYIEDIKTSEGEELKVAPLAIEPLADIAILGALDDQEFYEEAEAFEAFCENTEPVPLCERDFELRQKFSVHILTHKATWIEGHAAQYRRDAEKLWVNAYEQIEGGTSGGPIVNDDGELVGIVSNTSETSGPCDGLTPRPHVTLPVWAVKQIKRGGELR